MNLAPNKGRIPGAPDDQPVGEWPGSSTGTGRTWQLIAVGDVGLSGRIGRWSARFGGSAALFREVAPALQAAHCALANLETPLMDRWSPERMFAGSTTWASDLRRAGFRVLHLAANHMLDHGAEVFAQTIRAVRAAGIQAIGVGATPEETSRLTVQDYDGLRVGWLAAGRTLIRQPATPRLWELKAGELLRATEQARSRVDLLLISLHWGAMLVDYPHMEQYRTAHRLVDAGASAVLMHHAHVLQGVEIYAGAPICYNLGNFLFDPSEGELQRAPGFEYFKLEEQLTTGLFQLSWRGTCFDRLRVAPVALPGLDEPLDENYRLRWAEPHLARSVLTRLGRISDDLAGDFLPRLEQQLWATRRRGIRLHLGLVRRGELWRIPHLLGMVRPHHVWSLVRTAAQASRRRLRG